ncbi:unnamed protein product [Trichogramma brassicae]|uniref:PRANC domain-containing protein n=1 Tax=Trichogramma brassicae TaxID=86971 RepID=A0A6H5HWS4_9HYME|nr:unnamed protein product [Trichogramma brassicae]
MDINNKKMAELLLRRGADPNLAEVNGLTPLHLICMKAGDHNDTVEMLFEVSEQQNNKVQVNALSKTGNPPLMMALINNNKKIAELLLRRGADPTIVNDKFGTPLHYIANSPTDPGDFAKKFFKIIDEQQQWTMQIDAVFSRGHTPLHSAVFRRHKKLVEVLLRRGADPNLPSEKEGFTALHTICCKFHDDDLVQLLFKLCGSRRGQKHQVAIDARDKSGRTALQMAVANLLPDLVDVLLDNGADLSSFVMPDAGNFCRGYDYIDQKWDGLRFVYGALAVVERLEKRGYLLGRRDAIKIMTFFHVGKLFEKSSEFEKCLRDDEEFTNIAKEIIITSNLSLYDLILLRPEQAEKRLTYKDYMEIKRTDNLDKIPKKYRDACMKHLCEKMSRGYFKRWALNSFLELIHHRLPILCCDMIIQHLNNEDLLRMYQAAEIVPKRSAAETYETHAHKRVYLHGARCSALTLNGTIIRGDRSRDAVPVKPMMSHHQKQHCCSTSTGALDVCSLGGLDLAELVIIVESSKYYREQCSRVDLSNDSDDELHTAEPEKARRSSRKPPFEFNDTDEDADEDASTTPGERFIDFVASSGYKDEPDTDEKNEPLLHRTTPVHRAAKRSTVNSLFEIYNSFDVNYIDEDGLTHFHVACQYGYEAIVAKFLELGQDPNCFSQETRDARYSETPLNLSLINNHQRVAELLLSGADPNLCSQNGDVPLHIICESFDDSDDGELLEKFFAINDPTR